MSCPHRHDIVHKSLPLDLDKQLSVFKPKKMQQHRDSERQPVWQSGELQARTCQVTISLAQSQHGWIQFLYSTLICFLLLSWEKKPKSCRTLTRHLQRNFALCCHDALWHTSAHTLCRGKGLDHAMLSFLVLQREQMIKKGKKAYEGVILLIAFRVFLYRLKTL